MTTSDRKPGSRRAKPLLPRSGLSFGCGPTVVLWIVLLAMFYVIYFYYSDSSGPEPSPRGALPSSPLPWPWWIVPALVGVVLVRVVWGLRRSRKFSLQNSLGLEMLARGELDRAAEHFARLSRSHGYQHVLQDAAAHNCAVAILRQGRFGEALGILGSIERRGGFLGRIGRKTFGAARACQMALIYALQGDLPSAETWIAETRKRLASGWSGMAHVRFTLLSEAIVRCRKGDFEGTVRGIEAEWREAEGTVMAGELRALRLVRAFAEKKLGRPVEQTLAAAGPSWPGELDYLGAEWPELREFQAGADRAGSA